MKKMVSMITKRDGRLVPYDETRIRMAIELAMTDSNTNGLDRKEIVDTIVNSVNNKLSNVQDSEIDVETIQNYIVQIMKEMKLPKLAKNYTSYRNKRTRIREKKSSLMKSIGEMNNASAITSNSKRENANIDGDTAMGTMLKFGTTTSKEYYLNSVLPEEMSKAHREGYIHIHDLDFFSLTTTCLVRDTKILLKVNDNVFATTFAYFDEYFKENEDKINLDDIKIFHDGVFVDIKWCARRKVKENERVYKLSTRYDSIELTENHQVPIIRDNEHMLVYAKEIKIGDKLIITKPINNVLKEINCIDLFKDIDDIVIENSNLIRKIAHDNGFITEFYKTLKSSYTAFNHKYAHNFTLREYLSVRHLFTDYLDEHQLILNVRGGKSHGFSSYLQLTHELGKFMGYIFTEGYIQFDKGSSRVIFTNTNQQLLSEYTSLVANLFNLDVNTTAKVDRGNCFDCIIKAGRGYITKLFNGPLGIKHSSLDMSVPFWLFNANVDFLEGFISGLVDGDGGVDKSFSRYVYTSSCKSFIYDIKYLLDLLNIPNTIRVNSVKDTVAKFGNELCVRKADNFVLSVNGVFVDKFELKHSILYQQYKGDYTRKLTVLNDVDAIKSIEQTNYSGYVYDIETETHYFTANSFVVHNCCQIPLGKLLAKGFATGHGYLRTPNSIGTAAALACIAIQSDQNDQHGGQSIPTFDYSLAPYVAKSFIKNISKYLDMNEVDTDDIENIEHQLNKYFEEHKTLMSEKALKDVIDIIYQFISTDFVIPDMCVYKAVKYTDRDTYQAMEALIHNLNTMASRAGAQVPFSSLNFGTDTSEEGRMVSKNLMLAQEAGLGNGETPIFPITIFKIKSGVNYNKEDPNYDLFKLACKVSAKRLFPNFVNQDAPYNLQYYKEGNPDTEIATMGCVDGKETIIYRYNEGIYQESFKEFADRILNDLPINIYSSNSTYVNTDCIVDIYDSNSESFVNCKKLIININVKDWVKLTISDTITIDCTIDHPLPIYEVVDEDVTSVRMRADEVSIGDKILLSNYNSMSVDTFGTITNIEFYTANKYSYDVETESDRFDVSGINSHNCRTRVIGDVTDPDNQIVTGRGNLSFTSINLPRLAIEANHDINKFYELLDYYLDLCRDELLFRFKIQCNKTIKNYPFLMGQGVWIGSEELGIDEHLDEVLKHGTLSIGFVGLAETLISLIGKHHGESDEAQQLGLEIIGHMRDYTDRMSEKYHLNFSVLATPAESLAGRFAKINRALFGEIKGVTDNGYLTNSNHIPVYYNISAYDKIKKEAPYHALCNAGHICYIELDGDPTENLDAFEKVVRCMHDEGIGYGAINHPVDRDPVCGYVGIIGDVCPCCGRHEGEALTPEAYRNIIAKKRLDSHYGEA